MRPRSIRKACGFALRSKVIAGQILGHPGDRTNALALPDRSADRQSGAVQQIRDQGPWFAFVKKRRHLTPTDLVRAAGQFVFAKANLANEPTMAKHFHLIQRVVGWLKPEPFDADKGDMSLKAPCANIDHCGDAAGVAVLDIGPSHDRQKLQSGQQAQGHHPNTEHRGHAKSGPVRAECGVADPAICTINGIWFGLFRINYLGLVSVGRAANLQEQVACFPKHPLKARA